MNVERIGTDASDARVLRLRRSSGTGGLQQERVHDVFVHDA